MSIAKTTTLGLRTAFACGALGALALGNAACVRDTDCGICDPDNLILESISGLNYASKKVHFLNPTCEGESCPEPRKRGSYFVEEIVPCLEAEDTEDFIQGLIREGQLDADETGKIARFKEEFCRISPLVVAFGIEFVFNNLLDPASVELVRKRPDQPKLFEVYSWKTRILDIVGPTTRYNGDFVKGGTDEPDVITRLVNLSCVQNLADDGIAFTNESYEDPAANPCNSLREVDGDLVPAKMRIGTDDARLQSYRGIWTNGGNSCSSPQDGADTCCSECDFLLGTKVAKYGVTPEGTPRSPNDGTAITCDPEMGDPTIDCRDFIPSVDRSLEQHDYEFWWECPPGGGCEPTRAKLPRYDLLRETHPDNRPDWIENRTARCSTDTQCFGEESLHNLPGTRCVGVNDAGQACRPDFDMTGTCTEGVCRPQWFVGCSAPADTTGGTQGYCFDVRFHDAGAAGCYVAGEDFEGQCNEDGESCRDFNGNQRLANCNGESNDATYTAAECCQGALGAVDLDEATPGIQCDPLTQPEIRPVARYDRDENLPAETRGCVCKPLGDLTEEEADLCARTIEEVCYGADGDFLDDREGQYAVKFVERPGGVVYDPAIKGVEWRPGDIGGVPRARIEVCAEDRGLIQERNRLDGWRANDSFAPENYEDFDRAMCSGQEYTVTFAVPGDDEYVVDKVGNSMEGHAEYTFETPQFHVVPGSGFPTDNLRVGACDQFSLRFSNKYDMSPENQRKLAIYRVDVGDPDDPNDDQLTTPVADPDNERASCGEIVPVAGGPGCYDNEVAFSEALESNPCAAPCLTVDIADQFTGEVRVQIDPVEFGVGLELRERYRLLVPALGDIDQMSDPNAYYSAFWDACGMPLVAQDAAEYSYDFSIDEPKCKEDRDRDGVQRSCDNAELNFNPDQGDLDRDGIGDVVDKCPTVSNAGNNSADSDKDGVGNDCDVCRQTTNQYNDHDNAIAVPDYMLVRNIPWQGDADEDGIGDVCDNCVQVANCQTYGPSNPYEVGDPIDYTNRNVCQRDDNGDLVGDTCAMEEGVGIGMNDDFDGDALPNISDLCPRQPAPAQVCAGSDECPAGAVCDTAAGVCNHIDTDDDNVGDICDTCPFTGNPNQTMDGTMQEEDEDGDFVGNVCETNNACAGVADSRPFAFYEVSANGQCCTVQLTDDGAGNLVNAITGLPLLDPYGHPVRVDCEEAEDLEMSTCRQLPNTVAMAPGVLTPPPGCEDALAAAGYTALENPRLTPEDVGDSLDTLWNSVCFLPQVDQDYDGLGDPCDFCPFDYDPGNEVYKDENGRLWPKNGAFCNGEFSEENRCEGAGEDETGGTDETAGTDESGGMETTGGADTTGG